MVVFFLKINMCCYILLWFYFIVEDCDLKKFKFIIFDNVFIFNLFFLLIFFENKIVKENNNIFLKIIYYLLLKFYLIVYFIKSDYFLLKMCYVK